MAEKFGSAGSVNNNLKIYDKQISDFFFFEPTDEYKIIAKINILSTTKSPAFRRYSYPINKKGQVHRMHTLDKNSKL